MDRNYTCKMSLYIVTGPVHTNIWISTYTWKDSLHIETDPCVYINLRTSTYTW